MKKFNTSKLKNFDSFRNEIPESARKSKDFRHAQKQGVFDMKTEILISIIAIILVVSIGVVLAHENFNETKQLIDSNISCDKLSDEQLNEIGDYYMEQMHPGESHEIMHEMMGGEDSEITKSMHINMAKSIYCGENTGMMGCGMMNNNMMSSGMMGNYGDNMMYSNMMGGNYYGGNNWNIYNVLYLILLVGLITLVILAIIRLTKGLEKKR